ncbi:MAG: hypothetical protein GX800_04420 [Clostridiaceae bacterium]|nr:hypothetical protein [Clostridiaceae bacterium]
MRRVVCLAICLAIIVPVIFMCFAADTDSAFPREEEYRLLKALGILSDDITEKSMTIDGSILRIDAIKAAVKLVGAIDYGASSMKFSDIKEGMEDAEYVDAARGYGMIEGYGNNVLYPYNYISYNEVIKILTIAAGYGEYAKSKGGYPTGYLLAANAAGITGGVRSAAGSKLKLSEFCKLAFNTLTADVMGISMDNNIYIKREKDQNLLWTVFRTYIVKGVVTADKNTSIYSEKKAREGHIEIDGTLYHFSNDDGSYIGRFVRAYIREDETNGDEAILLCTDRGKNNVFTLNSDLIDTVTGCTGIKYYENEESVRTQSLEITQGASYIHNDLFAGYFGTSYATEDELRLQNATFTFIDNDGDNVYDIVMVSKYTYFEVATVSVAANSFFDRFSGKVIKFVDSDTFRYSSGLAGTVSSIAPCNILAVYLNKSETLDVDSRQEKEFIMLSNFVTGATKKASGGEIWINAEISSETGDYKINTDYVTELSEIENKDGRFLLDAQNKIIAFERNAAFTEEYGYVIDAASATGSGLISVVALKMLIAGGTVEIISCNDRIRFCEDNNEERISAAKLLEKKDMFMKKLIQYSTNSSGKLISLKVPEAHPSGASDNRFNYIPATNYYTGQGVLSNKYLLLGDANIFVVPLNEEGQEEYDYYGYKAGSRSLLPNNADRTLELFSVDDRMRVGAVLFRSDIPLTTIWPTNPMFVVEKTSKVLNTDGKQVTKVYGYSGNKYTSYEFKSDNFPAITNKKERENFLPTDLAFGDIIQVGIRKGAVWDYKVLLDASSDESFLRTLDYSDLFYCHDGADRTPSWSIAGVVTFAHQTVSDVYADYITVHMDDIAKNIFAEKARNIFLVTDDKIEAASFGDIREGDKIFATWLEGAQGDLYIYR